VLPRPARLCSAPPRPAHLLRPPLPADCSPPLFFPSLPEPNTWNHWGGDLANRRWAQAETKLSPANAGALRVKWEATVVGSTSATPTVHDGFVYVPDWEGEGGGVAGPAWKGGRRLTLPHVARP
jgi:hypothetical protein